MRAATLLDQPRAIGEAYVSSKLGTRGSCIDGLRQSGALKLLFPARLSHLEAVAINTSGGITGGDRFELHGRSGAGSHLVLTTQAAERGYRAQAGQVGQIRTRLEADADSTLFWLPQETILYQQAAVNRHLQVDLHDTARFLMVEPILFGRRAMGEDLTELEFIDRIDIRQAGRPIYKDGLSLKGNFAARLDRPSIGNGARAVASLVFVAPEAPGKLEAVRALLGPTGGASLLSDTVLVLRLLGEDGYDIRRILMPILDLLTHNTLPQSWRL